MRVHIIWSRTRYRRFFGDCSGFYSYHSTQEKSTKKKIFRLPCDILYIIWSVKLEKILVLTGLFGY